MSRPQIEGTHRVRPTETIPQHLWQFAKDHDALEQTAEDMHSYLRALATEASIPFHTIETRAKTLSSYQKKTAQTLPDGSLKYTDPSTQIDDCVAARVIVFTMRARRDFVELLTKQCTIREHTNPGEDKHNGYDSDHLIITSVTDPFLKARYPELAAFFNQYPAMEIQVRTVAGHAWAEYEHDVRYKSAAYKNLSEGDRKQVDQWFIEAGGLRRYLDNVFDEIDEFLLPSDAPTTFINESEETDAEILSDDSEEDLYIDVDILEKFLRDRYPRTKPGNYSTIQDLIHHLHTMDVTTIAKLEEILARNDGNDVADRMDYPSFVTGARKLDDELLAALTDTYINAAASEARKQLLRLRLRRVRGNFAIYVVNNNGNLHDPVTAARAVRELTRILAQHDGPEATAIPDWIALSRKELPRSSHPRVIRSGANKIYIANNLSRINAERLMKILADRLPEGSIRITRAGDQIIPAPSKPSQ